MNKKVFFDFLAFASQKLAEVFAEPIFSSVVKLFLPSQSSDEEELQSVLFNNLEKSFKGQLFKSESTNEYPPHESDVTFRCIKG